MTSEEANKLEEGTRLGLETTEPAAHTYEVEGDVDNAAGSSLTLSQSVVSNLQMNKLEDGVGNKFESQKSMSTLSSVSDFGGTSSDFAEKGAVAGRNRMLKLLLVVPIVATHLLTKVNTQYPKTMQKPIFEMYGWGNDDKAKFQLINTAFNLAQAITALTSYSLVQRWGFGICLPLFAAVMAMGTLISSLGFASANASLFWLVILGEFVMGLGVAPMKVSYQAITKKWIKDKNLSLALSCILLATGCGMIVCSFIPQILESSSNDASKQMRLFAIVIFAMQTVAAGVCFGIVVCDKSLTRNNPHLSVSRPKAQATDNVVMAVCRNTWAALKEANGYFWMLVVALVANNISLKPFNNFVQESAMLGEGNGRYAIAVNGGILILTPLIGVFVDFVRHRSCILATMASTILGFSTLFLLAPGYLKARQLLAWTCIVVYYFAQSTFAVAFWPALTSSYAGGPQHKMQIGFLIGFMNCCDAISTGLFSFILKEYGIEKEAMVVATAIATCTLLTLAFLDKQSNWFLDGGTQWMAQFDKMEQAIKCKATRHVWAEIKHRLAKEKRLYGPKGYHMLKLLNDVQPYRDETGRLSIVESLELNLLRAGDIMETRNDA